MSDTKKNIGKPTKKPKRKASQVDEQERLDAEDRAAREKIGATKCPHCGIDKRELEECQECKARAEKPPRIPGTNEDGMPVMLGASKHNRAIYDRMSMTQEQRDFSIAELDAEGKPKKGRGGRPPIDRMKALRYLVEAFKLDATDEEACSYAGVSETWYYDEMKKNDEFSDQIHRAQRYPFLVAKGSVVGAMETGDNIIGLKYLERRQKKLYSPRVEVTGEDGDAVQINLLTEAKKRSKKYSTPKK
jgi:hypothetical protein